MDLKEAELLIDENKFSEAILAYRKLAELGDYSDHIWFNLQVSIDQEQAGFAREIGKKGSFSAKMFESHAFFLVREFRQSIDSCTEILNSLELDSGQQYHVRSMRLQSATKAFSGGNLVEDTEWLLNFNAQQEKKSSNYIVSLLSSITNVDRIPELKRINELTLLSAAYRSIISLTIEILEKLECLKREN